MKRALIVFLGVAFVFGFAVSAGALPSLGVIPLDTYLDPPDPFEGPFAFTGGDPQDLVVWYGNENHALDTSANVFIATTEAGHTLNGLDPDWTATHPPDAPSSIPSFWHTLGTNEGWDLGDIDTGEGWTLVGEDSPLSEGGGTFYIKTVSWTGGLGAGEWIYAWADESNDWGAFDNGGDSFAPPTMSTSVPEPATLILLGSGLLGLAAFGRGKLKKS